MAGGRVGFPFRDSRSGEAADAASAYGNHPAAMAEEKRLDRLYVLCHIHFEDFEDDLWPACKLAAHFTQGTFADLIQIPINVMHRSFDFSKGHSTETAQAPS